MLENFEMELVFEDENIIWGIEFLNDNSILASIKSGSIYHYKNGVKTEINGLPEIYFRGQGGLLDIALHPEFKENKWLYLSYASEDIKGNGGNTTIARAKLIDNSLVDLEVLYKGSPNTKKGQHFGSRMEFDNENYLYFSIGDRGNRNVNPQDITIDGGKINYTSTDQRGNFRIGDGVVIDQSTGTVSGDVYIKSLFTQVTPFILALGGD